MQNITAVPTASPTWRTHLLRADPLAGWDGRCWTSGVLEFGFPADEAVASVNLDPGAAARIDVRARDADGRWWDWTPLCAWGAPGARHSFPARATEGAPTVATDVLVAPSGSALHAAQVRVSVDASEDPRPLRLATVNATAPIGPEPLSEDRDGVQPTGAAARLRPLSQRPYPARGDLGGGGAVWCSPTSLTMVLDAWDAVLPQADAPDGADPRVPAVAAEVFDAEYDGTGNWGFNVAYAGTLGMDAFVTRLRSLRDARVLTDAGIPLVASIRFSEASELPGADYAASSGHLVVIRGFTADGDVLVADPANPGGDAGLRTYPRAAFDTTWARSRRTVYVIVPRGRALPVVDGAPW